MAAALKQLLGGGYKAQRDDKAPLRVKAVLLDVNGSLFAPSLAAPAFRELGLAPELVELWFTRVLRDGFAAQAAGLFRPFKDVGAYHLDVLLREAGAASRLTGVEAMSRVIAAWAKGPCFPDVPQALSRLHAANIKVAVLTNGSAEAVARPVLAASGVAQLVKGPLLDISAPQVWKPFGSAYAYAVRKLGLSEHEVLMVASHPWDVAGACRAGLRGVYVQRSKHEPWPDFLPAPDATVDSFEGLTELLGLAG